MKVLTVVGARPQFVKAAVLSPSLRKVATEVLVHTGQHYDRLLSEVFFTSLNIPEPDYDLGVGSGSPGTQTGRILAALDDILLREKPHVVLVYGDTNSTLAGALAAVKLQVPVVHVEAGLRSFNRAMPEEINRVVTDHVSSRLYCPNDTAVGNLKHEGIVDGVKMTGDVMDVAVRMIPRISAVRTHLKFSAREYYVATFHRQENTDNPDRLREILRGLSAMPLPVVVPLHPRTRERMTQFHIDFHGHGHVQFIDPIGYQEMIGLVADSAAVFTDSGGLQREAAALSVPCFIMRDETEWEELVQAGKAILVGADADRIVAAIKAPWPRVNDEQGHNLDAVEAIVTDLIETFGGI